MTRLCLALVGLVGVCTAASAAPPPAASAAAYHPQGKFVAFGTYGEVRLFNPQTGEPVRKLGGQTGRVTALAFTPDGRTLAVASGEPGKAGAVRFYAVSDTGEGSELPAVTLTAHADAVYAITFSPDGKRFASAGYDRVIHVFDATGIPGGKAELRRTLKDHSDTVYGLAFHPDGKLLASASADRAVKVWDADSGKRLYTLSEPADWVYAVAWSPDGKQLAAAGVDRSIRVWAADRDGGRLVHGVFAHAGPVWRVAYTADGKTLYSAGEDRVVKAWDATKMVEARTFAAQPDAVLALAVRPDGKQLAVGRFDGVGQLLDADGKLQAAVLPAKPLKLIAERATPAAVVRGQTARVTVTGKNLDELKAVNSSIPDVSVKPMAASAGKLELDVTVPPTLAAGAVQLTLENDAGKAAPLTVAIDRYPAVPESGLTDSAQRAMPVTLPTSLVGSIDRAGDVDYFRFDAKAGQQVGVQVVAAELGSKLDPALVLTDASGTVLVEGTGGLLGYTVPAAGTYAVGVRDREFRGGPDMTYRLHVGDVPVVTGVFPLAVAPGTSTTVHVDGVNLGRPGGLMMIASPPGDAAAGTRHPITVPPTPTGEKPLGPAAVMIDPIPSAVIDPAAGADVRVPGSADGVLLKPGAAQAARFAAKKGDRLVVEVLARRAGSPVDPVVEVLDAAGRPVPRVTLRCTAKTFTTFRDHDSASPGIRLEYWTELATDDYLYVDGELTRILALPRNPDDDCQFYQVGGQRLGFLDTTPAHHSQGTPMYRVELHPPGRTFPPNGLPVFTLPYRNDDGGPGYGKDARLFFDVPADGTYQARVSDARGAAGPGHAYRVTVRRPKPDFTVSFNPTAPAVWKGGAIPVSVTATRLDGFDGPIRVELQGLPAGFSAPAAVIEGNLNTTAFALFAAADAKVPANGSLKLVAKAAIDGKEVAREAAGGLPKVSEPGDIVTTTRQDVIRIKPGQETRFVVDVERRGDFKGRIPLDVRGLPHGVRVLNVGLNGILVTERDASREVVLYAEPWVQPADHPIVVLARSERKNTEHAAKSVLLKVEK